MYIMHLEWCLTPRKHWANTAYGSNKWQGLVISWDGPAGEEPKKTQADGGRDAVFLERDPRRVAGGRAKEKEGIGDP